MPASSLPDRSHPPSPTEGLPDPRFAKVASEKTTQTVAEALRKNGMSATVVANREEAVRAVLALIPAGAEVLDATSQTLAALGLPEILADPARFHGIRPELMRLRKENAASAARKLGAAPDVVVGSVHAITESGEVVVASATGSQLGPYAYGAGKVVWVVGTQKLVPDLATAFARVRGYSLPLESERAQKAYGFPSVLAKLLIVNREATPGRVHVILVRENLGF